MANEKDLKIRVPVSPEIDKRAVSNLNRDLKNLEKNLGGINISYKNLAKISQMNVGQLKRLSDNAETLGDKLSEAAQKAYKDLGRTTKKISEAEKKAGKLARTASEAGGKGDKPGQDKAEKEYKDVTSSLTKLNTKLNQQIKTVHKHRIESDKAFKKQQEHIKRAQSIASLKPADAAKGIASGLSRALTSGKASGVLGGLGSAASSGVHGIISAKIKSSADDKAAAASSAALKKGATPEAAAAAGSDASAKSMASAGEALGGAAAGMMAVGAGLALFVKMLMMASDHMTKLNKTLVAGTGLANDFAMTGDAYRQTIDGMRQAAMSSRGALLKFGMDSDKTLQIINAFGKNATGSLGKTSVMLKNMGGDNLGQGMETFAKNAHIYGRALGMDSVEIAGMMGDMVSDIGNTADNAMQTVGNLVKTASTSGMPVQKFMDVFREALPNVDLFTNRLEQLTGTIKLLSKAMSPKDVKDFMSVMNKGFDQMDIQRRTHMALLVDYAGGKGTQSKIMKGSVERGIDAMSDELPDSLKQAFRDAFKSADPMKAVGDVAAKAVANGAQPAFIGDALDLARTAVSQRKGEKGDVLETATSMRNADALARMETLERVAKSMGKSLSGLGEVTAAKFVGEDGYKAVLKLNNTMVFYQSMIESQGITHSNSINANLLKLWKQKHVTDKRDEKYFKSDMKALASQPDKTEFRNMIMSATTMKDKEDAAASKPAKTAEDLAAEQYNATTSVGDKLDNVVGYWLEKIFGVVQPILNTLDSFFEAFTSDPERRIQIAAEKQNLDIQMKAAEIATDNQKNWSTGMDKSQKDSLSGMSQIIKEAANTKVTAEQTVLDSSGPGNPVEIHQKAKGIWGGVNNPGIMNKLQPILSQIGKMSVKSFDNQKGKTGKDGTFFRSGDKTVDDTFRALLDKHDSKGAQKFAQDYIQTAFVKGDSTRAMNIVSAVGGALAESGVVINSGDPNASHTPLSLTKEQTELARQDADFSQEYASGIKALGSSVGSPSVASGTSSDVTKNAVSNQNDIATAVVSHADTASDHADTAKEQLTTAVDQYDATSDVLSLLKKGVKFEDSWMSSKLKTMLDKVVLDNVQTALLEYALLTNPDKVANFVKSQRGMDPGMSGTSGIMGAVLGNFLEGKRSGGYTGDGPAGKPAGIVHKGEYVVPKSGALVTSGGGRTVNVGTVNVHIQTNDPHAVKHAIDEVFNHGH